MVCEITWYLAITCAWEEFYNSAGTNVIFKEIHAKTNKQSDFSPVSLSKNIGMLCMQELFFRGRWITWNIVSDVYIFTKGKKSINAEKNENVELTHTRVFCGRLCVLCE